VDFGKKLTSIEKQQKNSLDKVIKITILCDWIFLFCQFNMSIYMPENEWIYKEVDLVERATSKGNCRIKGLF
jgi:hypothetical protein